MSDLVEFLRARYDEDEREMRSVLEPSSQIPELSISHRAMHVVVTSELERSWPVGSFRMLTDLEAKRRIIDEHPILTAWRVCTRCSDFHDGEPTGKVPGPCQTLRLLALPYADHPDYREEWKP